MYKTIFLNIFFYFYIFEVIGYATEDYLKDISNLFQNIQTYEYPKSHTDFYRKSFNDVGSYGTFDFIIVGAGSAGTVLANRLSEEKSWNILVLEGGGEDTEYTDIPAMAGLLQFTRHNWGYKSTKQTRCCLGMDEQKCNLPRGKSLGGSSTINYMVYTRGSPHDYNLWADQGNPGWSYDEVLKYFLKSENSSLKENFEEDYHSQQGSLHVEHVRHFTEMGQDFMKANIEMGRKILDYNGKNIMGYSRTQTTTINGRRCSGNKAFLRPVRDSRSNLKVEINAFVIKLIINEQTKAVEGVEFIIGDKKYQAFATKEVILSAGAIGSPHLLMLSGVGPKKHLESMNISVLQDLPVGLNMADHPFFFYLFPSNFMDPGIKPLNEMVEDYIQGNGFLTNPGNIQSIGFIDTKQNFTENIYNYPDIEILFSPFFGTNDGFINRGFGVSEEIMKSIRETMPAAGVALLFILQHPKSRGSVTLQSNNPFDHPLIDINFFEIEDDLEVILAAIKDFIKLLETTKTLKKYNISIPNISFPGCKEIPFMSDDYWRCAIRHLSSTLYHHMGTCKMGPLDDPATVVDNELRVKGLKKLRVVDASIFPLPTTGHTNVPTFMVAEKASDMIKNSYL